VESMSQTILRFMQECSPDSVSFGLGPSECVIKLHVREISALSKLVMGSVGNYLKWWDAICSAVLQK